MGKTLLSALTSSAILRCSYQILANGDLTGYSLHADFQNGWDLSLLQSVINTCNIESSNGQMTDCAPLRPYIDEQAREACQIHSDVQIPSEDVGIYSWSLTALPGDNPLWNADTLKPNGSSALQTYWGHVGSLKEGVGAIGGSGMDVKNAVDPTTNGVVNSSLTGAEWEVRGCIAEGKTGRALDGGAFKDTGPSPPVMTLRRCAVLCESAGWDVAGLEFGQYLPLTSHAATALIFALRQRVLLRPGYTPWSE